MDEIENFIKENQDIKDRLAQFSLVLYDGFLLSDEGYKSIEEIFDASSDVFF